MSTTTTSSTPSIVAPPSLQFNAQTPYKKSIQSCTSSASPSSHSNSASATHPRLLYRGALSLPDSHLLLDGLTFTIALPADDPHAGRTLLESPLPLALESMRGRPSLRFGGIVRMADIYCDFSERVSLHVHPRSILTRQLFEHTLCTTPVSPSKGHTDSGIRISLGDVNGSSTSANNDIVVFGRPHPSSSIMQLCVTRILPAPPKPTLQSQSAAEKPHEQHRPPRPDDPTPRKPPAGYAGIARIGLGMKRSASMKLKGREEDRGEGEGSGNKRLKKQGNSIDVTNSQGSFKIPALPHGKSRTASEKDVFDVQMDSGEGTSHEFDLEAQNKTFIKRAVVRLMSAAGVSKTNPSFRDFYNQVYHGTAFALRAKMHTANLEADSKEGELVDRIAQAHITLYLGGVGVGVMLLQQG